MFIILVICVVSVYGATLEEGDFCEKNGVSGICKNIRKCPSAIEGIKNRDYPQTCSFLGSDPVVCCRDSSAKPPSIKPPTSATPGKVGGSLVDDFTPLPAPEAQCDAIPLSITAEKTGQKAWDKCIDHQQKLLYPCEKNVVAEGYSRRNLCTHNAMELIIGDSLTFMHEFPHMALLGFNDSGNITWEPSCAGALVDERFVLTSAHCVQTNAGGGVAVSHVQLTSQRKNNVHAVKKIVTQPSFDARFQYHDIALLELDKPIQLDQYTVPACLVEGVGERAYLTGWNEDAPQVLLKDRVTKLSTGDCKKEYPASRRLPKDGVDESSQACYSDRDTSKMQAIRGGILQTNNKIFCMYTVVGVPTFGTKSSENVALYIMVAAYLPWIESVLWP